MPDMTQSQIQPTFLPRGLPLRDGSPRDGSPPNPDTLHESPSDDADLAYQIAHGGIFYSMGGQVSSDLLKEAKLDLQQEGILSRIGKDMGNFALQGPIKQGYRLTPTSSSLMRRVPFAPSFMPAALKMSRSQSFPILPHLNQAQDTWYQEPASFWQDFIPS